MCNIRSQILQIDITQQPANNQLVRVVSLYLQLVFAVVQYLELLGLVVQRNLLAPRHLDVLHRGLDLVHHSLHKYCICFYLSTLKNNLKNIKQRILVCMRKFFLFTYFRN